MTVMRAMAAGDIPGARDLTPAPCAGPHTDLHFRYDASIKAMRASRDVSVGETTAAVPAFALPDILPGDILTLTMRVGSVLVERQVEAAQPGQAGAPIFVKAADGRVFVAVAPKGAP